MRHLTAFALVTFFLTSCGIIPSQTKTSAEKQIIKTKELRIKIVEDVINCKSLIDEKKLDICGKCILKVENNRLLIQETDKCVPYQSFGCVTKDGLTFVINNKTCSIVSEYSQLEENTHKEEQSRKKLEEYKIYVSGEDCTALIRTKGAYILSERDRYIIVEMDNNTYKKVKELFCVKEIEKL